MAAEMVPPTTGTQDVDEFLRTLDHPMTAEFELMRSIFMAADPGIAEGIKWKGPSFFFKDWFATFNLRTTDSVQVILHTGAKVKASAVEGVGVQDPEGLVKWLAKDRGMLDLADRTDIEAKREALTALIQDWISRM